MDYSDNFNNYFSLSLSSLILFGNKNYVGFQNIDYKNLFLFGEKINSKNKFKSKAPTTHFGSKFYIREGHFIFRNRDSSKEEIYLHFNAAPLGYLSIAAHGHSDCLSFVLHIDGIPYLIDPGTYVYHSDKEWREYFVSSTAHNTITFDGKNQAFHAGPTLWLNHYKNKIIIYSIGNEIEQVMATHDGYKKYGINHKRKITFNKFDNNFIVNDEILLMNKKKHICEMAYHLSPNIEISELKTNKYLLKQKGSDERGNNI